MLHQRDELFSVFPFTLMYLMCYTVTLRYIVYDVVNPSQFKLHFLECVTFFHCFVYNVLHHPVTLSTDYGDDHWLRRHGTADVDGKDRGLVFFRVRHFLLRTAGGKAQFRGL